MKYFKRPSFDHIPCPTGQHSNITSITILFLVPDLNNKHPPLGNVFYGWMRKNRRG